MKTVKLKKGDDIENVTRITEPMDGKVNVHTPGKGYRVVSVEEIEEIKG